MSFVVFCHVLQCYLSFAHSLDIGARVSLTDAVVDNRVAFLYAALPSLPLVQLYQRGETLSTK